MLEISVITPSFNQARFLPACIASVALQEVRAIEHLVLDPGSEDGSRDIAQSKIGVTLIAEPDEGQADAVGRGFQLAKGDVLGWLNSDDEYNDPSVFGEVLSRFAAGDEPDIVYGRGIWIDEEGKEIRTVFINDRPEDLLNAFQ